MKYLMILTMIFTLAANCLAVESDSFEMDKCYQPHFESLLKSMESLGAVESYEASGEQFTVSAPNMIIELLNRFYIDDLPEEQQVTKQYHFDANFHHEVTRLFEMLMGFEIIKRKSAIVDTVYENDACKKIVSVNVKLEATKYVHMVVNAIAQNAKGYGHKRVEIPAERESIVTDFMVRLSDRDRLYYDSSSTNPDSGCMTIHFRSSQAVYDQVTQVILDKDYIWNELKLASTLHNNHVIVPIIWFYLAENDIKDLVISDRYPEVFTFKAPAHVELHFVDELMHNTHKVLDITPQRGKETVFIKELDRLMKAKELTYSVGDINSKTLTRSYTVFSNSEEVIIWLQILAVTGECFDTFIVDCNDNNHIAVLRALRQYQKRGCVAEFKCHRTLKKFKVRAPGYVRTRLRKLSELYQ